MVVDSEKIILTDEKRAEIDALYLEKCKEVNRLNQFLKIKENVNDILSRAFEEAVKNKESLESKCVDLSRQIKNQEKQIEELKNENARLVLKSIPQGDVAEVIYSIDKFKEEYCSKNCPYEDCTTKKDCIRCINGWVKDIKLIKENF